MEKSTITSQSHVLIVIINQCSETTNIANDPTFLCRRKYNLLARMKSWKRRIQNCYWDDKKAKWRARVKRWETDWNGWSLQNEELNMWWRRRWKNVDRDKWPLETASAGEAASETALPAALTQTDRPTRLPYTVYTISVSFFLNYRGKIEEWEHYITVSW